MLSRLEDLSKTTYIPTLSSAMTHIGIGDHERALACLERAYEERYGALVWLSQEPIYDPRFQALLQRTNFPTQANS